MPTEGRTTSSAPVTTFERSEPLPGLRLVTETMPHVLSVSIGFWLDTGARDETDDIAGAAHFLEHMLFKGTHTRSAQDIANAFDAVGGEVNAYSAREHTCFYARVLDQDLPMAVEILADMFRSASLRPDEFESERRVILEEIHMAADMPEDVVHDVFARAAWPGHPLGRPVLGTTQTIGSLSVEDLARFYRTGYLTDRLVVAVSGNVRHADVAALLRGALEPGTAPVRRTAGPLPTFGAGEVARDGRESEQVHVVWGLQAVGREDPDRYPLSVLSVLYGGGMSSRLFQQVREQRGLAYSIYSAEHLYKETGSFTVYAGTSVAAAPEVLKIVRDEASALAAGEVTAAEVERAKGHVRGGLVLSMDDPGGRMSRLGRSELIHGDVLTVDELLAKVDAVTADDITRVAGRVFGSGPAALASVGSTSVGALDFAVESLAH